MDVQSNLEDLNAFNERIRGLDIPELERIKSSLTDTSEKLEDDMPRSIIDTKTDANSEWFQELFRLLELTRAKINAVRNLMSEKSKLQNRSD